MSEGSSSSVSLLNHSVHFSHLLGVADIGGNNVCVLPGGMELDVALLVELKEPKSTFENLNSGVAFQKS